MGVSVWVLQYHYVRAGVTVCSKYAVTSISPDFEFSFSLLRLSSFLKLKIPYSPQSPLLECLFKVCQRKI